MQARSIPWDCADWQAFAHSDRATAILESLAENRGKTLYCGIDQSDTFGKAETWAAGKDRNERDDTVYWGERGSFRGFIAAQEGWLTEGESGITGQSIATIFEFPKKEKKRRRETVVIDRMEVPASVNTGFATPYGPLGDADAVNSQAVINARTAFDASPPWAPGPAADYWQVRAKAEATAYCAARGYNRAVDVSSGSELWSYSTDQDGGANYQYQARKTRRWAATCEKTKRRRR